MYKDNVFEKLLSDDNARELRLVETGLECLKNNKQIPFTLKMSLEQIHGVELTSNKLENQRTLMTAMETLTGVQKVIAGGFLAVVIGMLIKFFTGGGGGSGGGGGGGGGGSGARGISNSLKTTTVEADKLKNSIDSNARDVSHTILHQGLSSSETTIVNELLENSLVNTLPHNSHGSSNDKPTIEELEKQVIEILGDRGEKILPKILYNFGRHVNHVYLVDSKSDVYKKAIEFMLAACEDIPTTMDAVFYMVRDMCDGIRESCENIDDVIAGKTEIPYRFSFDPPHRLLNAINALDGGQPKSHWLSSDVLLLAVNSRTKLHKLHNEMRKKLTPEEISTKEELLEQSHSNPIVEWMTVLNEVAKVEHHLKGMQADMLKIGQEFEDVQHLMEKLKEVNYSAPNYERMKEDFKKIEKLYGNALNMFGFITNNLANSAQAYSNVVRRMGKVEDIIKKLFIKLSEK